MLNAFNSFIFYYSTTQKFKIKHKTTAWGGIFIWKQKDYSLAKMMTIQPFPNAQMKTNPKIRQLDNT